MWFFVFLCPRAISLSPLSTDGSERETVPSVSSFITTVWIYFIALLFERTGNLNQNYLTKTHLVAIVNARTYGRREQY